ncbi:PDDEXK nuclease domain-containing protein [Rathayibacter sp. AY1D2]|uniref:PDDEXK nuclease domain-containing protein n=2 Tax=unclassified Rathayibacter TaxID=2609250 RepID=UPI0028007146|nr:PDDEXK nuclease domain-containing protein [Rathayibacter sp. AY1D2]
MAAADEDPASRSMEIASHSAVDDCDAETAGEFNSLLDAILIAAVGVATRIRDNCGMNGRDIELPNGYEPFLRSLTSRVQDAQLRAQRTVNAQLISLYWDLGHAILDQQAKEPWGTKVLDRLAEDLRREFPAMTGLSRSNLFYMRAFAAAWPDREKVPQAVGHLPWGHVRLLLDKLSAPDAREAYAAAAAENSWTRSMLLTHVKNQTLERAGRAPSNYVDRLAPADSGLAREIAKDPYVFDFLNLTEDAAERDMENALLDRIAETLQELGTGFTFAGRQVHFDVSGRDFYLDLLFFHTEQLRYVVVELKKGDFEPAFTGQLGFYIALVDERLRRPSHAPTIGILICGDKDEHIVRYALSQAASPIAVATYTYDALPDAERLALPDEQRIIAAIDVSGEANE